SRQERAPLASGVGSDLWPGEKMLPTEQAGPCLARDATGDTGRSLGCLTSDGLLRAAEHGFYRAGESDHPTWDSGAGSSHLGHGAADSTLVGSPGVVARLLSLRASSRIATSGARGAPSTRGQTSGATLPATDSSHGSRQNEPTMDGSRSALVSLAVGFCLR